MRAEVEIPEGVEVKVSGKAIEAKGPLGSVERDLGFMPIVSFSVEGNNFVVSSKKDGKRDKMFVNTAKSHIQNLIEGVTKGYKYKLAIVHVHFPMRLSVEGDKLKLENFLGSKTTRKGWKYSDVDVKIAGKDIFVEGLDKEHVGQTAANLEQLTRIKEKDRRVFRDGIYLVERGNINE